MTIRDARNDRRTSPAFGARCGRAPALPEPVPAYSLRLSGRQDHDHLAAFESGVLLHLGKVGGIVLHPVEQLVAELLVGQLAAAEAQGDLHLVAFFEEALHRAHLHVIVMVVDHRPELDLLDLDHFLFFAGFGRLLLRLVFIFTEIKNFADRRNGIGGYLDEIEPRFLGSFQGQPCIDSAMILAGLVDQLHFAGSDLLVDTRTVFLDGRRGSHWSANGAVLLYCCDKLAVASLGRILSIGRGVNGNAMLIKCFCSERVVSSTTSDPRGSVGPMVNRLAAMATLGLIVPPARGSQWPNRTGRHKASRYGSRDSSDR